jgi:MerR family transcriptional regulator, thiopeptide resistance regulator
VDGREQQVARREVGRQWTVGRVAAAAGVTVRTLHHWEAVGLLAPSGRTAAGYRSYAPADLERLQQVLAYRALGFGLDAIAALLDDPAVDVTARLRQQSRLLTDQAHRLLRVAAALDRQLEARRMGIELEPHEVLEVFGTDDPGQYAEEAERRWGSTDAYRQSQERTRGYGKADWLRIRAAQEDLERRMAAACAAGEPPDGDVARALAKEHRQALRRDFYDCSVEMHRALAQLYVDDERFAAHYDRRQPGLARWLRDAVTAGAGE